MMVAYFALFASLKHVTRHFLSYKKELLNICNVNLFFTRFHLNGFVNGRSLRELNITDVDKAC